MPKLLVTIIALCLTLHSSFAAEDAKHPVEQKWNFDGYFGTFDRQSIQRGFQVYKEVCAACHGLKRVAYRNLQEIGFSEAEIKAIAAGYTVVDGPNDDGEMFERPGIPSDKFVSPFKNEKAARAANNGAYPPDLSLIIKARENGANYVYSILTGYNEPVPQGFSLGTGQYYNPYMPGGRIAMAPPLADGQVQFMDGTEATVHQMSKDVVNFLQWAAEPEMEKRKYMGIKAFIYLTIFTVIFIIAKRRVWANLKH